MANCENYSKVHIETTSNNVRYRALSSLLIVCAGLSLVTIFSVGCTSLPDKMETTSITSTSKAYPRSLNVRPKRVAVVKNSTRVMNVQATYFGKAPYICTPSGFGRKSGCFLRS